MKSRPKINNLRIVPFQLHGIDSILCRRSMLFRKIYNKVPIAIQDQDLNCQMGGDAVFGSFVKFLHIF